MRFVILHYHILKNAGSTFLEILDRSFSGRFHSFDTPEREAIISPDEVLSFIEANPRLQAFSSHQIRYPLPHSPGILFFDICFLRDPIDRVRSMYDYFCKRPAPHAISDLANRTSLGDFIAAMVTEQPLHVTNVQVNLLAQAGDSDEPNRNDLALARDRILRASFPGVVDCFDESVVAGEYFLRAAFPALDCALPPVNVSKGLDGTLEARIEHLRSVCDPAAFAKLVDLNALDFELLHCARQEVMRRFRLVPNSAARLDELRHRVASGPAVIPPVRAHVQPSIPAAVPAPGMLTQAGRLADSLHLLLSASGNSLFDRDYYVSANPAAADHPLLHFVLRGAAENRNPHPLFDVAYYRKKYLRNTGTNPLAHYLKIGGKRGFNPHPLFDAAFYLDRNPDVRSAGMNPLLHYLAHGAAEGRKPHPLFDPEFYLAGCPKAQRAEAAINPLIHFLRCNAASPHPLFDSSASNSLISHVLSKENG